MMTACEAAVHYIFPTIRALIAEELIQVHGLTQKETAKRMGLTQPAISQYKKHLRGQRATALKEDDEVMAIVSDTAARLSRGEMTAEDATRSLCEVCEMAREGGFLDEYTEAEYAQCH